MQYVDDEEEDNRSPISELDIPISVSSSFEDYLYEEYHKLLDKGKTTAQTFTSWMREKGYSFDNVNGYWY